MEPKGEVYWGCAEDECMDCKDTGQVVAQSEDGRGVEMAPCPSCDGPEDGDEE